MCGAFARRVTFELIFVMIGQSQATVTENQFSLLEEGDSIVCEIFGTTVTRSFLHCSAR